ncbi:FMN-dependent dehydrogenase-domain-containing protein [Trametes elegans]|nr:FMN-dependent dehydrogenase-domain-containing protein [Trametes elegans]
MLSHDDRVWCILAPTRKEQGACLGRQSAASLIPPVRQRSALKVRGDRPGGRAERTGGRGRQSRTRSVGGQGEGANERLGGAGGGRGDQVKVAACGAVPSLLSYLWPPRSRPSLSRTTTGRPPGRRSHLPDTRHHAPHFLPGRGRKAQLPQFVLGYHQRQCVRCHRVPPGMVPCQPCPPGPLLIAHQNHPGGAKIILKYAGKDATSAYEPIHPPDALDKNLPPEKHLGVLDSAAASAVKEAAQNRPKTKDELRVEAAHASKLPLSRMLSLRDIEAVARQVLSYKALAYYASAADDELTYQENARAFSRFFFHPRVMRPVSQVDPSTTILGYSSSIPVFVSGAALARLGHPLGEANITRGCGRTGTIQMVSSNASLSYAQIADARVHPTQPLFFQLYKHRNDKIAEQRVREAVELGYNAIFLTVDAVVAGNRERDIRAPFELEEQEREADKPEEHTGGGQAAADLPAKQKKDEDAKDVNLLGTAGALIANDDLDMTWERTIPWLRSVTKLPIVIKGIQSVEDAVLAAEAGVDGILISNHGGRQLEYALPGIEVLYRIRKQRPDIFHRLEVYIDGGARRGTDVLKALCLGAKAVGMGRPFLYAQSAYGEDGVVRTVEILKREIETAMRLLGVQNVSQLVPEMVENVNWQPLVSKL